MKGRQGWRKWRIIPRFQPRTEVLLVFFAQFQVHGHFAWHFALLSPSPSSLFHRCGYEKSTAKLYVVFWGDQTRSCCHLSLEDVFRILLERKARKIYFLCVIINTIGRLAWCFGKAGGRCCLGKSGGRSLCVFLGFVNASPSFSLLFSCICPRSRYYPTMLSVALIRLKPEIWCRKCRSVCGSSNLADHFCHLERSFQGVSLWFRRNQCFCIFIQFVLKMWVGLCGKLLLCQGQGPSVCFRSASIWHFFFLCFKRDSQ